MGALLSFIDKGEVVDGRRYDNGVVAVEFTIEEAQLIYDLVNHTSGDEGDTREAVSRAIFKTLYPLRVNNHLAGNDRDWRCDHCGQSENIRFHFSKDTK